MESVSEQKRKLRRMVKEIPKMSALRRAEVSGKIFDNVAGMDEFFASKSIFAFVGVENEPDTYDFIKASLNQGKRVSVPLCMSDGIMVAKEIHDLSDLKPGKYGIPEPEEDFVTVEPEEIDFVLVPCVACSPEGKRLGHGKGYYDRFLPQTEALRVMVSAECFVFDEVPTDEFDCRADFVVTENECRKIDFRY